MELHPGSEHEIEKTNRLPAATVSGQSTETGNCPGRHRASRMAALTSPDLQRCPPVSP